MLPYSFVLSHLFSSFFTASAPALSLRSSHAAHCDSLAPARATSLSRADSSHTPSPFPIFYPSFAMTLAASVLVTSRSAVELEPQLAPPIARSSASRLSEPPSACTQMFTSRSTLLPDYPYTTLIRAFYTLPPNTLVASHVHHVVVTIGALWSGPLLTLRSPPPSSIVIRSLDSPPPAHSPI